MTLKGNRMPCGSALRANLTRLLVALAPLAVACSGGQAPTAPGSPGVASPTATASAPGSTPADTPTAPPTPSPTGTSSPESRDALATAASLLHDGRLEEAAAGYEAIAKAARDPGVRATAALGAGVASYEAGDRDGSIALLQQAVSAATPGSLAHRRSAYLLGLRLNEGSRFADAALVLAPEAGVTGDPLQPYILLAYAEALTGAKDPGASAAWGRLEAVPNLDSSVLGRMYLERADLARTAGDDVSLARWLGKLVDQSRAAADRLELATVARRLGDGSTFEAQLRAIISNAPGSPQAPAAIQLLKDAGITVDPGLEGFVDYRRGSLAAALAVLGPAVAEAGLSPETLAFREFYLAAANEDSGNTADAVRWYDATAATGASSPYVHRAKYWAARVLEGSGDVRSASARYTDLVLNGPPGEFSGEAAFRAGYTLYRAGDPAGAVAAWNRLGVKGDARLLYWKGRAAHDAGDAAGAASAFAAAFAADPLGFYGSEAGRIAGKLPLQSTAYVHRDLSADIDWSALAGWLNGISPGKLPGSAPTPAADLVAVGLRDDAAAALDAAADGAGAWRLLELAREAHDLGLLDVSAGFAIRIQATTGGGWVTAPRDLLRLAYPIDYVVQLDADAKANNLDPLLFAALIRQESLWDASAGSNAGALGLTQVIPPTGQAIANSLGVSGFSAGDLFRPAVSLRFGAYYLAGQLRLYGNPYLALAAYNAGPGNASRWASAAGSAASGPDIAEGIDIPETADYVEKVMDHYQHYLAAYNP